MRPESILPLDEIAAFREFLVSNPHLLSSSSILKGFRSAGLTVLTEPYGLEVPQLIACALDDGRPLSVIRIGDGEGNLLSYGMYPGTPVLDELAVSELMSIQQDGPQEVNGTRSVLLRTIIRGSIASADVVGVRGIWWPGRRVEKSINQVMKYFIRAPRGMSGLYRGIDQMRTMCERNFLHGKLIASAHLYLSILSHLHTVVRPATRIVCVTNVLAAVSEMSRLFPDKRISMLEVGRLDNGERDAYFLQRISSELCEDLVGTLVLVGAGPWAELYCTWVKERGGVGVDLGSGFDLLSGRKTRPVHEFLDLNKLVAGLYAT
jgi:hypothetical protein